MHLIATMKISHPNVRTLYFSQNKEIFARAHRTREAHWSTLRRTRSPPQPVTMSTTVAELHGLMRCYGSALFLCGLWSDITGEIADVHIRTDANNLVTTASTIHQPEQKETMHLMQMLSKESNSGQMHDLAHVRSEDCLADSLTKHSAKADELIKAVLTGNLLNVDAHPPFRTMLQNKAFLVEWLAHNTKHGPDIVAFAGIAESMFAHWGTWA